MEWACTVKRKYFDAIKDGRKGYEVRKRVPKINLGDVIFICCKNEVLRCRVAGVLTLEKERAWFLYAHKMCIEKKLFDKYLLNIENVSLIKLHVLKVVVGDELAEFRSVVGKNPQWFCKVKF